MNSIDQQMKELPLYIDDVRLPSDTYSEETIFAVARSFAEAIEHIILYKPQFISFDHDLGEGLTGYDIAKTLIELDMLSIGDDYISKDFQFNVHSANPVGKENIQKILSNYMKRKFNFKETNT